MPIPVCAYTLLSLLCFGLFFSYFHLHFSHISGFHITLEKKQGIERYRNTQCTHAASTQLLPTIVWLDVEKQQLKNRNIWPQHIFFHKQWNEEISSHHMPTGSGGKVTVSGGGCHKQRDFDPVPPDMKWGPFACSLCLSTWLQCVHEHKTPDGNWPLIR